MTHYHLPICTCCYYARVEPHRTKLPDGTPNPRPTCMECGEKIARKVTHCAVPLNKSSYMLVTDRTILSQLNPKRT